MTAEEINVREVRTGAALSECRLFTVDGRFEVDPDRLVIRGLGGTTRVEPKIMDVLRSLVAARGRCVSKDELLETVWGVEFASDDVVWRAVSVLRKAFDETARTAVVIESVPRRGYRFAADIEYEPRPEPARSMVRRPLFRLAAGVAVVVFALGALAASLREGPEGVVVPVAPDEPSAIEATRSIDARALEYEISEGGATLLRIHADRVVQDEASGSLGFEGVLIATARPGGSSLDLTAGSGSLDPRSGKVVLESVAVPSGYPGLSLQGERLTVDLETVREGRSAR